MLHPSHPLLPLSCRRFLTGNQPTPARHLPLVFVIAILSACATSPHGRMQISTPAPIGDVYSDVNMRVHLATAKSISALCADDECAPNREFDQQVQQLGARLAKSAFDTYPDLVERVSRFEFVVAEKEELGSTSNAAGKVVIFRGVQELYLDEQALAFVIAREMGHIIGRHHDENSGTSILLSVLVGVLFPASNIFHALNGSVALANATSSAASSATSYVGSQALLASVKPDQLREADSIAVNLLAGLGWSGRDTVDILEASTQVDGDSAWAKDFRISVGYAKALEEETATASNNPEVEPLDFQVAQNIDQEASASGLSEMELNAEPALEIDKGNKPVAVADELVAEPGKTAVNMSEGNTHFENAGIVAKNEVSVSPDAGTADVLTLSEVEFQEAKLEEEEASIEDGGNDILTDKSRPSRAVSYQAAKMRARSTMAKKTTTRASLNKNGGKVLSKGVPKKTASKVVARNTKLKLAKATISSKQVSTKKSYAVKSSKVRLGMAAISKAKTRAELGSVKFASAKSRKVKANQIKARLG